MIVTQLENKQQQQQNNCVHDHRADTKVTKVKNDKEAKYHRRP